MGNPEDWRHRFKVGGKRGLGACGVPCDQHHLYSRGALELEPRQLPCHLPRLPSSCDKGDSPRRRPRSAGRAHLTLRGS